MNKAGAILRSEEPCLVYMVYMSGHVNTIIRLVIPRIMVNPL